MGVALLAMPIGVIASNFQLEFNEVIDERKKREVAVEREQKRHKLMVVKTMMKGWEGKQKQKDTERFGPSSSNQSTTSSPRLSLAKLKSNAAWQGLRDESQSIR